MNVVYVPVDNPLRWRWQAVAWAVHHEAHADGFVALLTNNTIDYPNDPFPNRLFVGTKRVISFSESTEADAFQILEESQRKKPSFLVGYLGYDLKNQLEKLSSRNPDRLQMPDVYFAEPEWIIDFLPDSSVAVSGDGDVNELLQHIADYDRFNTSEAVQQTPTTVRCRVTPADYQANVRRIKQHILAGDVYELNYCIEFFAEHLRLDPLAAYQALNDLSPMPFSSFVKIGDQYIIGASPERFLKKVGDRLITQPIKGTIRRGQTPEEDNTLRTQLITSEKERAENLMIVDLVRNDLARSAKTGTVQVDELFGIYGFRQVYQMISTVSATLRDTVSWADSLRNAFPMGSMTGAPKVRAMELIDELEVSRRGVYSGAVGFVTPDSDFDFSVVIRTLFYDAQREYASFSVGSAITFDAEPAQEWDECLLKASAIRKILES